MQISRSQYWTVFEEDRHQRLRFTVQQSVDGAAFAAVDLSAATAHVYFRAYSYPPDSLTSASYLVNTDLSKASDGSDGVFDDRVVFTAGAGQVVCELVFVDAAVANASAPSGYREEVLKKWTAEVLESVQPA